VDLPELLMSFLNTLFELVLFGTAGLAIVYGLLAIR
jgi:hypothetical protein